MVLDAADTAALLIVGLFAGLLGGLAGLGGSILMIPAMALLFHGRSFDNQHLYQAAAMAVNVAVSVPAAVRHKKSGMIRGDLFRWMLPGTLVLMVVGVLVGNLISSAVLERVFAVFVAVVALQTVWAAVKKEPELDE
ncbi:MAG: TSUP family transporter, partial [Planctomycetes bacterium]|nr:TSUP family transporter [Planctomycetota bacterium]